MPYMHGCPRPTAGPEVGSNLSAMPAPPTSSQSVEFEAAELAAAPWFVVHNQTSGKEEMPTKRQVLEAALQEAGRRYQFITVEDDGFIAAAERAAQLAAAQRGVLVAAGGDGTIHCAAQAALRHGCPLALIPQGTFNLIARNHGYPEDSVEAVRALQNAKLQKVQVGLVNARVFLANAAVGLYPKLLEDREAFKEQLGKRRRWVALLALLYSVVDWRWQMRLEAEIDGVAKRFRTPSLFVCNNNLQLTRLGFDACELALVGQGQLGAIATQPVGLWAKLKLAWRAAVSSLHEAQEIDFYVFRSLNVTTRSARKLKVATDGEVHWMQLPLRFTVSPCPLLLLVPPAVEPGTVTAQP